MVPKMIVSEEKVGDVREGGEEVEKKNGDTLIVSEDVEVDDVKNKGRSDDDLWR